MRKSLLLLLSFVVVTILAGTGCQAMFTTSPFAFMAPDPGDLPPAQLNSYGESALSSGNEEEIETALAAIASTLSTMDPDDPNYGELSETAAELTLAAAGLTLNNVLTGDIPDLATISDTLGEAGAYFVDASEAGVELEPLGSLMAGMSILITAVGGAENLNTVDRDNIAATDPAAVPYIEAAEADPALLNAIYGLMDIPEV